MAGLRYPRTRLERGDGLARETATPSSGARVGSSIAPGEAIFLEYLEPDVPRETRLVAGVAIDAEPGR